MLRDPWIVFPCNLQGRHINEAGAKGASLVTVRDNRVVAVEHRTLDVVRWQRIVVDCSGAADEEAVLNRVLRAMGEAALRRSREDRFDPDWVHRRFEAAYRRLAVRGGG